MTGRRKKVLMYVSFIFVFSLMVLIATSGSAPYSSTAINIGGFSVAWYAIFILTGIVFAFVMGLSELNRFKIDPNVLYDGIIFALPLAIVGARLHYVLFNLDQIHSISDVFNIQSGGLGIHGAVIVTFIFIIFFAKYKKISYWFIMEIVVVGFFVGQMIGRWGNFMNQELYGPVIDNLNWLPNFIKDNMYINNAYRHPVFLYESLLNLLGVLLLVNVFRKSKFYNIGDGLSFYLVWYGLVRIPVELLRMNSGVNEPLTIFGVYVSIWISVLFILGGIILYFIKRKMYKNLSSYDKYSNKAILLDLDGTVLDTADLILENFEEVFAKKLPKVKLTDDDYRTFIGPTLVQTFSNYSNNKKEINDLVNYYVEVNEKNHEKIQIKPFEGVLETLQWFKDRNYQIGVVSSKASKFVKLGLTQTGLIDYIDLIIGSDDVTEHKPSGQPLIQAINAFGIDPSTVYYVGDHENDIKSAKNANIKSILVAYSLRYEEGLAEKPEVVIKNFNDLINVFEAENQY